MITKDVLDELVRIALLPPSRRPDLSSVLQDKKPNRKTGGGCDFSLPSLVNLWVRHRVQNQSIRAIARLEGVQPSTIMRRIRRVERARIDPTFALRIEAMIFDARKKMNLNKGMTLQ